MTISKLVGGFNPSEKYESQMGRIIPIYEMENKKCSKPPTSICIYNLHNSDQLYNY